MFAKKFTLLTIAAGMLWAATSRAQDAGALLDLLVRKKLITDQEAEEVRADLTKEAATTSAGKLKLSTPITELELYGDARVRYEIRSGETGSPNTLDPSHDTFQRNRSRYRLRLGLRGTLADDWLLWPPVGDLYQPALNQRHFWRRYQYRARTIREER